MPPKTMTALMIGWRSMKSLPLRRLRFLEFAPMPARLVGGISKWICGGSGAGNMFFTYPPFFNCFCKVIETLLVVCAV